MKRMHRAILVQLILLYMADRGAATPTPCTEDSTCHDLQGMGSTCGSDGFCTNPFGSGCLYARLPGWEKKRVCNSEDPPDAAINGVCQEPAFDYMEVRILSGNWESILFNAWLLQILLSEILQVPTTLDPALPNVRVNFYDKSAAIDLASYDAEQALQNAFRYKDCRLASRSEDNYEPCAHLQPEFWGGAEESVVVESMRIGSTTLPMALGVLARETIFIPKFTAERDPTLLSYIGMQGEKNRQKLADSFLRPTSWNDYCEKVSTNNCASPDDVAERAPEDEEETGLFFMKGLFRGHFRKTDANNCTLNPLTCTGHVVDYACDWSSYVEPQFYYLNIALSGDLHDEGARGYEAWQIADILAAANATKSNVIVMWSFPDLTYQKYVGTDAELFPIVLPAVTQNCMEHRRSWDDQCSADMAARVGDAEGVCDAPPMALRKIMSTSLVDELNDPTIAPAAKSPAVPAIERYSVTSEFYGSFFDLVNEKDIESLMRDATCQWVVHNFDVVETWVPSSYPRVIHDGTESSPLFVSAVVLACVSIVLAMGATSIVQATQHRRVMRLAQVEFLQLLLAGILMISIGALLAAIPPSNGTCMAVIWFVNVGYTLELAPLLVKVAAINQLTTASGRMQKIKIERGKLFQSAFAVSAVSIIFLIVWTALDPPHKEAELALSTSMTAQNETIVYRTYYCSSESEAWQYVAFGWTCLLLFSSTVLAFQMRNVRQEFNESMTLAMMTYSHFVFAILRLVVFLLDGVDPTHLASYLSILLSVDSMATLGMYFLPKFMVLETPDSSSVGRSRVGTEDVLSRANHGLSTISGVDVNFHDSACSRNSTNDPMVQAIRDMDESMTEVGNNRRAPEQCVRFLGDESIADIQRESVMSNKSNDHDTGPQPLMTASGANDDQNDNDDDGMVGNSNGRVNRFSDEESESESESD